MAESSGATALLLPGAEPTLDQSTADGLDRIGVALSDPIRRGVLVELLGGTRCPSDLAESLGTSRSNLSNHLACLRGCGLIDAERAGRHLHYTLVSDDLAALIRSLVDVAGALPPCDDHAGLPVGPGGRP